MPAHVSTGNYILSIVESSSAFYQVDQIYLQVIDLLQVNHSSWLSSEDNATLKELRKAYLGGTANTLSYAQDYWTSNQKNILFKSGAKIIFADIDGKLALSYNDKLAVFVINQCITNYLRLGHFFGPEDIDEYVSKIERDFNRKVTVSSNPQTALTQVHNDAIDNKLYIEDLCIDFFAEKCRQRLEVWYAAYAQFMGDPQNSTGVNETTMAPEEELLISEEEVIGDPGNPGGINYELTGEGNFRRFAEAAFPYSYPGGNPSEAFLQYIIQNKLGSFDHNAFYRIFSKINPQFFDLNPAMISTPTFVPRLTEIGFFRLAGYAGDIAAFAKRRTANIYNVQRSAADFMQETVDVPWLLLLTDVMNSLKTDSILFANVSYYFPSFITFLIDALAVVGDYSNGGEGGGSEDMVNDPNAILDSFEKAFGSKNGKAFFEFAFKVNNTATRIKQVLSASPFRPNNPPEAPDIFHLRLGASNFFVPPLGIDVNTVFKAGSMMSGAIRQKNSPKFNSGYKETTIRLRLFFPNYEEVWGLTIDDASALNLNDEFKINFSSDGDSDKKIDKFLSSLRGLIAAFKFSPFLPIKNHYLNSVHGITAVGLSNISISTIPNFPFALAVDLELVNFNHKPFLPMLTDFNQAIHWGKYRQYMGKAAGVLNRYVNEEFLIKTSDVKEMDVSKNSTSNLGSGSVIFARGADDGSGPQTLPTQNSPAEAVNPNISEPTSEYDYNILKTNIVNEWRNGNNISLFAPAEAQTKIYLPSINSFRSDQEKTFNDLSEGFWNGILNKFGIDINESADYHVPLQNVIDISRENAYSKPIKDVILDAINILTAGANAENESTSIYEFLIESFIAENTLSSKEIDWLRDSNTTSNEFSDTTRTFKIQGKFINQTSLRSVKLGFKNIARDPKSYLDYLVDVRTKDIKYRTGQDPDEEKIKEEVKNAFVVGAYERFFKSGPIQSLMDAARLREGEFRFNEWEVPMLRIDFDPNSVIVNGVVVSLGNILVKHQVQMQDEPTYQHIGGKDSFISISMTILGEQELIKFKKVFDHISGLARLEHSTGVIGFLGIKNIITALAGIKYVMPLTYNVSTRPGFPHVYDVQLSLVDFDIFQQKREELSSRQQKVLVEHFKTKKNPFLRIKQMWGAFNGYPDFPLHVKDGTGETVGCLDPDFYFRSFEMFDDDVVNSFTSQGPKIQDYAFEEDLPSNQDIAIVATVSQKILEFLRLYIEEPTDFAIRQAQSQLLQNMVDFMKSQNLSKEKFIRLFYNLVNTETTGYSKEIKLSLLTEFISFGEGPNENNPYLMQEVTPAAYQIGTVSPNNYSMITSLEAALEGAYNLEYYDETKKEFITEEEISFHPDEVDFHKQIFSIPATDFGKQTSDAEKNRIPSIMNTAIGVYYGYIDRITGRFYLTVNGSSVKKESETGKYKFTPNFIEDTQTPDRGTTNVMTGVPGASALSEYQKPHSKDLYTHWEKMMVDTKYRDISGRMLRAFPTYMLWLIDEGGYFAGAKLFDNFYGLQSIIDFSVVSSEDLLGDTLIFRVSNLYSKLTKKESSKIFSLEDDYNQDPLNLQDRVSGILENALNMSRNILSGMRNEYIVDFASIRLKPGVRVHLRAGYGANPNSLQTVFNGVITNVEQGEIVTVTAQSDAIELGVIVNSTNKKGDSGKIDGGVDTGMYLSEPRDLMVRLLSMGSSRTREALAHATRGTIFSENKFGIRHFGTILYEPLSEDEARKNDAIRDSVAAAFNAIGNNPVSGMASIGADAIGGVAGAIGGSAFGSPLLGAFGVRGSNLGLISTLWANFSAQVDLEIFKRNIYPGNGLGIAQFLGGDIDDGWSTVASLVENETYNDRVEGYLGRLTDIGYNRLMEKYQAEDTNAKEVLDTLVQNNKLKASNRSGMVKNLASVGLMGVAAVSGVGFLGAVAGGAGLFGILSGRGGTNIFRTMGIVSPNDDDDLPGFDEVSFRAQTYMRTVWDLFQVCAKLLPNYIVAVRPFEDRSTVFYGKPHWLYTSGVVPVTTGFPGEEKARELGINLPEPARPNEVLSKILDTLNKNSNPLSDYADYFKAYEPSESFRQAAEQITTSTGVYAPSTYFNGKFLNFYKSNIYYDDTPTKPTKCKLPTVKGLTSIGPHLPIIQKTNDTNQENNKSSLSKTEDLYSNQAKNNLHRQISNLPPRYGFPYFTITENARLENSSTIRLPQSWEVLTTDFAKKNFAELVENYNYLDQIINLELSLFYETKYSLMPSLGMGGESEGGINLEVPLNFQYFYDNIASSVPFSSKKIIMPLPQIGLTQLSDGISGNLSFDPNEANISFEYQSDFYGGLTYKEWTAPETPEDEQFYVAMRWPYEPVIGDARANSDSILSKFKEKYGFTDLYGTAEDYKKRKVLVYNPNNHRAVVCKPAYFLWGDDNTATDYYSADDKKDIQCLVSPDAAYYLGIITYTPDEVTALVSESPNAKQEDKTWIETAAEVTLNPTGSAVDLAVNTIEGWWDSLFGDDVIFPDQAHISNYKYTPGLENGAFGIYIENIYTDPRLKEAIAKLWVEIDSGYRTAPFPQECMFAFVPDSVPVGVLSQAVAPVTKFTLVDESGSEIKVEGGQEDYVVGFGKYNMSGDGLKAIHTANLNPNQSADWYERVAADNNPFNDYYSFGEGKFINYLDTYAFAGNPLQINETKSYFQAIFDKDYESLAASSLRNLKNEQTKTGNTSTRVSFTSVWDPADLISIQSRSYYDESYDPAVSVIAGDGRTLDEAQQIWDDFRIGYHTFDSVKKIFRDLYGLDPDSEMEIPPAFKSIITGQSNDRIIDLFSTNNRSAADEFALLLGSDYAGPVTQGGNVNTEAYLNAIEFMRMNYIDASIDDGGLIEYYDKVVRTNIAKIYQNFFSGGNVEKVLSFTLDAQNDGSSIPPDEIAQRIADSITTPKQLFLLMVGIFRQRMWEDPFSRAWLVLKPDRKPGIFDDNGWSFRPVDPIFRAFIDPNSDYAKPSKKAKFLKLLSSTKGEGNSSSTYFEEMVEDVSDFATRMVGPLINAIGNALGGLMSMFKMGMQQMGYALSEVGNFKRQANILNKALNDSIYYSLGRPGSLLRAVDNPFTREYGEPVIEIREPFQRLHYISSFSHILSNRIQENINNVATVVTAVSDGKYPVTVALDKGAPAERQVEKTVETGIFFDNITGSGFTGFIHPLMHPLETFRGVAKTVQGAPDELSARRIATAHLKESIKDIYGGELILIGNTDIRPHDLVYLSDVYERMYGIFEVEQVVHHFTSELGFITSITPNALVTVNDPGRWFMTSWMHSWLNVQNLRNDTRIYMDSIRNANVGAAYGGNISVDRIGEILSTQIIGGFQFTHGSSALVKDIVANQAATNGPGLAYSSLNEQAKKESGGVPGFAAVAGLITGGLAWKGWQWIRDNVLDQHGCYVQYLNKNGQPMDAGLSYNQGMVVGQHHSKSLLPGILNVRVKARTPEGNAYIRTDDLLKSLGWQESEITDLTRHISYESALVHARVLQLSGMGPDKAGFDWQFKVICEVIDVIDGDTVRVRDCLSDAEFIVRFDGIDTAETNVIGGRIDYPSATNSTNIELTYAGTPAGKAKIYVNNLINNKIIVIRINQKRSPTGNLVPKAVLADDFEAGTVQNNIENYQLDIFGSADRENEASIDGSRALGTIFYYLPNDKILEKITYISNIFVENIKNTINIKTVVRDEIYNKSPFYIKFEKIYNKVYALDNYEYFTISNSNLLIALTNDERKMFSALVYIKILEEIYEKAGQWPKVNWDEYYEDGKPVTLNWELVVSNLARVFVKDLQKESLSVQTASDLDGIPTSMDN